MHVPKLLALVKPFVAQVFSVRNYRRLIACNPKRGISISVSFALSFYGILTIGVPLAHAATKTWSTQSDWSGWSMGDTSTTAVPGSLALKQTNIGIMVGIDPFFTVLSADGSMLYTINRGNSLNSVSGSVSVISTASSSRSDLAMAMKFLMLSRTELRIALNSS